VFQIQVYITNLLVHKLQEYLFITWYTIRKVDKNNYYYRHFIVIKQSLNQFKHRVAQLERLVKSQVDRSSGSLVAGVRSSRFYRSSRSAMDVDQSYEPTRSIPESRL